MLLLLLRSLLPKLSKLGVAEHTDAPIEPLERI